MEDFESEPGNERDGEACDAQCGPQHKSTLGKKYAFSFEDYLPYQLAVSQLAMHQVIKPESAPEVAALASLSKGDARILTVIALNHANSPTEIATNTGLDGAVITRHIAALTSAGLLKSEKLESDQRRKKLRVTKMGERVADPIIAIMSNLGAHLDRSITDSEKETLLKILAKLRIGCESYSAHRDQDA